MVHGGHGLESAWLDIYEWPGLNLVKDAGKLFLSLNNTVIHCSCKSVTTFGSQQGSIAEWQLDTMALHNTIQQGIQNPGDAGNLIVHLM